MLDQGITSFLKVTIIVKKEVGFKGHFIKTHFNENVSNIWCFMVNNFDVIYVKKKYGIDPQKSIIWNYV